MESENSKNYLREAIRRDGRKEAGTVGDRLYDIIALEDCLLSNPEVAVLEEMNMSNSRLTAAVGEGNTYWDDENGQPLGPYHFISKWKEYTAHHKDETVDKFLENLKLEKPEWAHHITTLLMAKNNMEKPIWLHSNENIQRFPFDGMHRLTRAFLDNKSTIPILMWNEIPDEAMLKKE